MGDWGGGGGRRGGGEVITYSRLQENILVMQLYKSISIPMPDYLGGKWSVQFE